MDWTIVAVPAGTLLGAGLAVYGGWLAVRQRERADMRAEWRHRLEIALAELSEDGDAARRHIGRELLRSLATDESAVAADRELARKFLRYEARFRLSVDLMSDSDSHRLDDPALSRNNEDDGPTGGDDDAA